MLDDFSVGKCKVCDSFLSLLSKENPGICLTCWRKAWKVDEHSNRDK